MTLATVYILLRGIHFASLMSMTGCLFFSLLLAPHRYRPRLSRQLARPVALGSLLTLLSAVLMLVVQTGLMSGDWHNVSNIRIWRAVLNTGFGQAWSWQLLFALMAALLLFASPRYRQPGMLISSLLQLTALAMVGHAAMHDGVQGMAQRTNHAVHLISASFWAGGLMPMCLLMYNARSNKIRADAIKTMMRFSRYGHLAVVLTIISGTLNSLFIANWQWPSLLFYYQLLLAKVLLVALMVAVALINRYLLVPRFRLAGASAQRHFIRLTQFELILALLVVALVSLFATLSPV